MRVLRDSETNLWKNAIGTTANVYIDVKMSPRVRYRYIISSRRLSYVDKIYR